MSDDLIKRLRDYGDGDYVQNHEDRIEAADRITALIAAGERPTFFVIHDFGCLYYERNDSCDCGYTEAMQAWKELTND